MVKSDKGESSNDMATIFPVSKILHVCYISIECLEKDKNRRYIILVIRHGYAEITKLPCGNLMRLLLVTLPLHIAAMY